MLNPRRIHAACAALAAIAPLHAGVAQAAAPRTTASLMQAEDKFFRDQTAGDAAALAQDLGDDLTFTHASGKEQTKAEFIAFMTSGKVRFKFIHPSERLFRLYGEPGSQVGISHENVTIDICLPHVLNGITTGVYADRGGRWQLVAWQTTDIKPAATQ